MTEKKELIIVAYLSSMASLEVRKGLSVWFMCELNVVRGICPSEN